MTKSTTEAFELIFGVFIFLSALTNIMFSTTDLLKAFDEVPTSQTVYNVQTEIPTEVLWTGAQVVGKLYRLTDDNVPIEVESIVFNTDKDVMQKQDLINLNVEYKQTITYNKDGKPTVIKFQIQ